ncbi:MAG: nuclear transport factor 2 family protein, partial [Flammeovirgaceae bacterium]|nr:nuclear transport factor 2 family protein [Flammeovirgaceae bacterium]
MCKITTFLFLLVNLSSVAQTQLDKDQIIEADKQLNLLITQHNAQKAESFYASDFILTTSSGAVKLKKDILTEIATPELQLEENETSNVTVRILETTAVLTGVLHQKGSYKGKVFDVKLNVTDTWVKTADGWKILAGHASVITP